MRLCIIVLFFAACIVLSTRATYQSFEQIEEMQRKMQMKERLEREEMSQAERESPVNTPAVDHADAPVDSDNIDNNLDEDSSYSHRPSSIANPQEYEDYDTYHRGDAPQHGRRPDPTYEQSEAFEAYRREPPTVWRREEPRLWWSTKAKLTGLLVGAFATPAVAQILKNVFTGRNSTKWDSGVARMYDPRNWFHNRH